MKRLLLLAAAAILFAPFNANAVTVCTMDDGAPAQSTDRIRIDRGCGVDPETLSVEIGDLAPGVLAGDAEISALAGLTSAANKCINFSGSGTAAVFDCTSYGRSLQNVANEAAFKALINAEAGTDFQAYDADLTTYAGITPSANVQTILGAANYSAIKNVFIFGSGTDVQAIDVELTSIAGLTSAADRLPYYTGSGTASLATFTAGGRSLINSAGTANTFPYFSSSNTVTLGSITTAGLNLLDDAATVNQRTTLGLASSTTDNAVIRADSTAGQTQNSGVIIDDSNNITAPGDINGDGGDQLVGFLQNRVVSTTTTLTASQCGSTIVNDSADVLTLPEASTVLGCRFTFTVDNASNLDVNPNDATDQISLLTNAAGDAIRNATVGSSITLEAVSANRWNQIATVGTWTDVN